MQESYNICGLDVLADFRHSTMRQRSEKYRSKFAPSDADIIIGYDQNAVDRLMQRGISSEAAAENMLTADMFYTALLGYGGFLLHSSAVAVDGKAYLFSAPSGTGKSTHTSIWKEVFGERSVIINDDKPALMISQGEVIAYGTPWSGKSDLNENIGVPVQGICVLERSQENFIHRISDGDAAFGILNQTIRPSAEAAMSQLLELVDKVVTAVPVWRMGCNISHEAARLAYETMSQQ